MNENNNENEFNEWREKSKYESNLRKQESEDKFKRGTGYIGKVILGIVLVVVIILIIGGIIDVCLVKSL